MGDTSAVFYRGYGNDNSAGGRLVVVVVDGDASPLPHRVKHSPTGMSWGYHGSGAADLARSLLIHALGDRARCSVCAGSGEVIYDALTDSEVPAADVDRDADVAADRFSDVLGCQYCEDGYAVAPVLYQSFKRDVMAAMPEDGWTLSRAEILRWVDTQPHQQ